MGLYNKSEIFSHAHQVAFRRLPFHVERRRCHEHACWHWRSKAAADYIRCNANPPHRVPSAVRGESFCWIICPMCISLRMQPRLLFGEFHRKVFEWWDFNHFCQLTGSMLFSLKLSWAPAGDNGSGKERRAFSCLPHKTNHIRSTLRSNTWDKMLILTVCPNRRETFYENRIAPRALPGHSTQPHVLEGRSIEGCIVGLRDTGRPPLHRKWKVSK